MKTSVKIIGIIGIIVSSLILLKFVHIIAGILFFVIGMTLIVYYGFINKNIHSEATYNNPQIHFISFADDSGNRKGGKYKITQQKINDIFKNHPNIKTTTMYGIGDVQDYFPNLPEHVDWTHKLGCMQKIIIILKTMQKIPPNEHILYHDSSPEIWNFKKNYRLSLIPYIKACDDNNDIIIGSDISPSNHTHQSMTSPTCMKNLGLSYLKNNFQPCSSWILLKNTTDVMKMFNQILEWFDVEACKDSYVYKDNDKKIEEKFYEHRGDQSLLTLQMQRHNMGYLNASGKNIFDVTDFTIKNGKEFIYKNCVNRHNKLFAHLPPTTEIPERLAAYDNLNPHDHVLEIGGNMGGVSILLSNILDNPANLVVVEPSKKCYDHLRKILPPTCHIFNGVITDGKTKINCTQPQKEGGYCECKPIHKNTPLNIDNKTFPQLEQMFNIKFDTLVIDCEGCYESILNNGIEDGWIRGINKIIIEWDGNFMEDILIDNGFKLKNIIPHKNLQKGVRTYIK